MVSRSRPGAIEICPSLLETIRTWMTGVRNRRRPSDRRADIAFSDCMTVELEGKRVERKS